MWKLVFLLVSTMVVEHQQYSMEHMLTNQNDQIAAAGNPQRQLELIIELQRLVNNQQDLEYLVKLNHREQVQFMFLFYVIFFRWS